MDYIVNNTGIPSSEWGRYKPAGVNPDGPSMDFNSLVSNEGDAKAFVEKLSGESKKTLRKLKNAPNSIGKREWADLMRELNAMGAVSDRDYTWSGACLRLIPLGDSLENAYTLTADMRDMLDRTSQWPGNPLEYLDMQAFAMRKWGAVLSAERNPDGTPKYKDVSPVYDQAAACTRVSGFLKDLLSSGALVSR